MKNKCYKQSKLKKQLAEKRNQGVKVIIWRLTPAKKQEIEELGYLVEPYLFSIKTRTFHNIKNVSSTLLKDLHYMKKRGKEYEVRTLKRGDKETLEEYGIKYRPVKYKIYLRWKELLFIANRTRTYGSFP